VLDGRLLLLGLHGAPCVAVVDPRPVNWFDPDPRSVSRGEIACYECIEKIDMDIIIVVIPSTRLFNHFVSPNRMPNRSNRRFGGMAAKTANYVDLVTPSCIKMYKRCNVRSRRGCSVEEKFLPRARPAPGPGRGCTVYGRSVVH
jgi:hypothetical protein